MSFLTFRLHIGHRFNGINIILLDNVIKHDKILSLQHLHSDLVKRMSLLVFILLAPYLLRIYEIQSDVYLFRI